MQAGTHELRRRLDGQEASPGRGKGERVARALCLIGYDSRALEPAHLGCAVTRLGCLRRAYTPRGRRTCDIVIRIAAVARQICEGRGRSVDSDRKAVLYAAYSASSCELILSLVGDGESRTNFSLLLALHTASAHSQETDHESAAL